MIPESEQFVLSSLETDLSVPGIAERAAELADRIARGESVDLEALHRDEPALAARLSSLLPAIGFLAWIGKSSANELSAIGALLQKDESGEGIGRLGDFLLHREIGRGGMGIVFEATQLSLGRTVALKVLPHLAGLDQKRRLRFQSEARIAASLEHKNIVQIFAIGQDPELPHFAMSLIEGVSLSEVIQYIRAEADDERIADAPIRDFVRLVLQGTMNPATDVETQPDLSRLSVEERKSEDTDSSSLGRIYIRSVVSLGIQAAEALAHAHGQGVLHRDIKPGNLLVDLEGNLSIVDFGLARWPGTANVTATGDLIGTLRYMSPEQAAPRESIVDHRTDIYSLGVTLYELFALRPAFLPDEPGTLVRQICTEEPVALRQMIPSLPVDLETIVTKMMAKAPTERYHNASEVADDLGRFLNHRPILARRPSLIDRLAKWGARHRSTVLAAVAMMLVVILTLAAAVIQLAHASAKIEEALEEVREERITADKASSDAIRAAARLRETNRRLRELNYVSDLKVANDARRNGSPLEMHEYLDRQIPPKGEEDLRDFAWFFLNAIDRHDFTLIDEVPAAQYLAQYSPDGELLAVAGADAVVRFYKQPDDHLVQTLETEQIEVNDVAFTPEGKTVATIGDDQTLRLWDLSSGEELWSTQAVDNGIALQSVFLRDGQLLATSGQETVVRLWNVSDGSPVGSLQMPTGDNNNPHVTSLAATTDGRYIAVTGPRQHCAIYDVETEPASCVWQREATGPVKSAAFSEDGTLLLLCTIKSVFVYLWQEQRIIDEAHFKDPIARATFLDSDRLLAIPDRSGMIHLHPISADDPTSDNRRSWVAHEGRIFGLTATPSGRELISTGGDGRIKRWESLRSEPPWKFIVDNHIWNVGLDSSGTALVTLKNDLKRIQTYQKVADRVEFRDLNSGVVQHSFPLPTDLGASFIDFCISTDGRFLFTIRRRDNWFSPPGVSRVPFPRPRLTAYDLQLDCLRINSERFANYCPHALASDHTGRMMAVSLTKPTHAPFPYETQILVYDLDEFAEARLIPVDHPERPHTNHLLEYAPDDSALAIGVGNDILLYDPESGEELVRFEEHRQSVTALTFSSDGQCLASVGNDRRLIVRDLDSGEVVFDVLAHPDEVKGVAFSPNGRLIVTRNGSDVIRFWNLPTKQRIYEFRLPTAPPLAGGLSPAVEPTLVFTPDGRRLILQHNGTALILQGDTPSK